MSQQELFKDYFRWLIHIVSTLRFRQPRVFHHNMSFYKILTLFIREFQKRCLEPFGFLKIFYIKNNGITFSMMIFPWNIMYSGHESET